MSKRPSWKDKIDDLCDQIVLAEEDMRERFCAIAAEAGTLRWSKENPSKKFRIMLGNRPLVECPLEVRLESLPDIEKLLDAADSAMASAMIPRRARARAEGDSKP